MPKAEYKILVVDDDKAMQEILVDRLSREREFRVYVASNGKEGLEKVLAEHPDLILLDLQMPIMSGISMAQELRRYPDVAGTKVIFLTNFDTDESVLKEISEFKPAFYLIKANINIDEVVRRIKESLGIWKG